MKEKKIRDKNYFRIETPGDDFPFYNGQPMQIGLVGWIVMLAFQVFGFLSLHIRRVLTGLPPILASYIAAFAFLGLCVLGLVLVTRKHWRRVFRKFHARDIGTILICLLLSFVLSVAVSKLIQGIAPLSANPRALSAGTEWSAFILTQVRDVFQLMGEEFIALIPFLAVLALCFNAFKMNRKASIIVALLVSSLFFGLLHLPTYEWNWLQCIFVIGFARIPFTLGYIRSKNFFIAFLTHFIFDEMIFLYIFLVSKILGITL